jgi:hypothetical protein
MVPFLAVKWISGGWAPQALVNARNAISKQVILLRGDWCRESIRSLALLILIPQQDAISELNVSVRIQGCLKHLGLSLY